MTQADNAAITISLNVKEVSGLASTLLEQLKGHAQDDSVLVAEARGQARQLFDAAIKVAASHSGSNFGYHGALYYKEFQVPPMDSMFNIEWGGIHGLPRGWSKREPEDVKLKIESLAGLTFAVAEKAVKGPLDSAKAFHRELLI